MVCQKHNVLDGQTCFWRFKPPPVSIRFTNPYSCAVSPHDANIGVMNDLAALARMLER